MKHHFCFNLLYCSIFSFSEKFSFLLGHLLNEFKVQFYATQNLLSNNELSHFLKLFPNLLSLSVVILLMILLPNFFKLHYHFEPMCLIYCIVYMCATH